MSQNALVDTHCHLNFPNLFPSPDAEVDFAVAAGVTRMIAVGCDGETSLHAVALAERRPEVYATVGCHPNSAGEFESAFLDAMRGWLALPKVVALGEIGLDYHWNVEPKEHQKAVLNAQLDVADELGCPVVFHCREAYDDLLDVLEPRARSGYLLHCFGGDLDQAARAAEMGLWFGVDGPVTYKSAENLRAVLRSLPPERLVIETDAPYLPPHPYRGKPNRPAYVALVNAGLAQALGMGVAECATLTTANAERFFGLSA
ncbi:MAG: hypothetical protein AMXMBFR81_02740 [Chthonomonas sp.]